MGSLRPWPCALVLASVLGASLPARAQPDNAAIAEELFNDAKRLLDQGKADQACPKFAESLRLDPTLGTRLNLARCYEVQGRTAKAWGQYKEVVRTGASDPKRSAIALARIAALDPQLARTTLVGNAEPGLKIKLDGDVLDAAIIGTAFPIDPGDHALELVTPGKKTRSMTFHVEPSQRSNVELPPLEQETVPEHVGTVKPDVIEPVHVQRDEVSQGKRIGGWVTMGLGGVALGVGAAFGIVTLGLANDVKNQCPAGPCPTQDGLDKNSVAHTDAVVSDILIPVGLAAIGVGIYLVVSAPHRTASPATGLRITPWIGSRTQGVGVSATF